MKTRLAVLLLVAAAAPHVLAQCPTQPATAQSPVNVNLAPGTVTFSWNLSPASGVTGYEVHAGPTVGSASTLCSTSNAATSCSASLNPNQYGWFVRAKFTTCPSVDSAVKTFTVGCPQSSPGNTSPAPDATNVSLNPILQWTSVADADKYDVYLGAPGQGCTAQPINTTNTNSAQITTALQPNTTYEWRVGARRANTTCPATFSTCQTFTTTASCAPAGAFSNAGPPDGSTFTGTPTLSWTPSAGAAQYFVHLGQVNPPPVLTTSGLSSSTTTFTPSTLGPGRYFWQVSAIPACGVAGKVTTSVFSFVVNSCPTAPQLDTPADNAAVTALVHFDWEPSAGATQYNLNAILPGNTTTTLLATTKDTEYTATIPAGATEWWVDAVDGSACAPASSAHRRFTVTGCNTAPPAPALVAPANRAFALVSPVTFQWSAVPGATGYRVFGAFVDVAGNTASDLFLIGATTTATTLTAPVPKGAINWTVEARFGDCPSGVSQPFSMNVITGAACSTTAATLVAPANNATGVLSPVAFQWTAVSGAVGYNLYINGELQDFTTDTSMTRIVADGKSTWRVDTLFAGCPTIKSADFSFTAGAATSCGTSVGVTAPANGASVTSPVTAAWTAVNGATAYRVYAAIDGGAPEVVGRTAAATTKSLPLPSGSVELFVEALFDTCPSIFSPHVKFTVTKAATCDSHKPVTLASPIGGAPQASQDVTFKWTAADPAALYRVWVSMNGDPFEDVGLTGDTQLQKHLAPGKGTWFVESLFAGCPAVASNKETFTTPAPPRCNSAPPALVSPVDNAQSVTSPVPFVWSAVTNATGYRLFLSLGAGEFMQIAETDDVTSVTRALPSGSYRWYVEAVLDACPNVRSAIARFTVPRAQNCSTDAPQLLAPAEGLQPESLVTLDWSPVSGAVGYVVFARSEDGPFTRLDETTRTRLTRHFPTGTTEWFVTALLSGCPSVDSRHSTFVILAQAGCDNPKPLLHSPPDHAVGIVSPVRFVWSEVPGATKYKVWAGVDGEQPAVIATSTDNKQTINIPPGVVIWFVEGDFEVCPPVFSAPSTFTALKTPPPCAPPERTSAHSPATVASGSSYNVRWSPVANTSSYEVQESATPDFAQPSSQIATDLFASFAHTVNGDARKWYYRVRAISSCLDDRGPFSPVVAVIVLPDAPRQAVSFEAGSKSVPQKVFIPGKNPPLAFSATTNKPWAHVSPSSGTVGPDGITLTVTYDDAALHLGANTASVIVTYPPSAGKFGANDVAPKTTVPVSVSTVTPVSSGGKSGPPQNSMIIPVIGHAAGVNNSLFESDVRIANTSATTAKYTLNFTLSGADGTQSGQSTTIQIAPGDSMALDDILTSFFGTGTDGASATGVLEIRPVTTSTTSVTSTSSVNVQTAVASSRTYNNTSNGSFGQYIPAILFSQFLGQGGGRLTLQQVAQSAAFRTNLGLVEGAGEPASVNVHVFNAAGAEVANIPVSLLPGEHKQLNSFLQTNNIALDEGRFEIEVTSPTGKVSAYASTVDNLTNDPLCVFPVLKGAVSASRYVIPGVADINTGFASWRTDIRIFNAGTSDANVTLTFNPQTNGVQASGPVQMTIKAGEVKAVNNALNSLYGLSNVGGAIAVTTPAATPLVVTARTYNQTDSGTYGQFIPAVTTADAVGLNERTLQLLQLEQSDRFRSNIGLAETTGNPATAEVTAITPDAKFAVKAQISLAGNEFRQLSLADLGLSDVYNVRVTVKVIKGTGRVTAYGSMIDQITQDPTYDPPL